MATIKGDVRLGDYTLRMDFNALCDAEEDFPGIMQGDVKLDSFRNIRTMLRHALGAHHPNLTDREVGEITQSVGLGKAAEAVIEAMHASFPPAEASVKSGNGRRPPAKTVA